MMRTLRADLRRYNSQDLSDDEGETGWKLVHGDVFRPPSHPMALAVLIGSGVQVFGMTVITLGIFFIYFVFLNQPLTLFFFFLMYSVCSFGFLVSFSKRNACDRIFGSFRYYGVLIPSNIITL